MCDPNSRADFRGTAEHICDKLQSLSYVNLAIAYVH